MRSNKFNKKYIFVNLINGYFWLQVVQQFYRRAATAMVPIYYFFRLGNFAHNNKPVARGSLGALDGVMVSMLY